MKKKEWKKRIEDACKQATTYQPYFDSVIDTLAQILETRDQVHEQYVEGGSKPTVTVVTDRNKNENVHRNPLVSMELELNAQALKYWAELGLTATSFKKLNVQVDSGGNLENLLAAIKNG